LFPGRAVGERLASQNISIINHFWHRPTISVRSEKHECVSADLIVICCADKLQLHDGGFVWNWTSDWKLTNLDHKADAIYGVNIRKETFILIGESRDSLKNKLLFHSQALRFF
jgi:hypothetical protein